MKEGFVKQMPNQKEGKTENVKQMPIQSKERTECVKQMPIQRKGTTGDLLCETQSMSEKKPAPLGNKMRLAG